MEAESPLVAGIDDVARAAGVSTATVSRALRGLPNVSETTRRRVRTEAMRLGYVPTPSASSLATGRTRTIGLLTPWVSRWFFSNVIEGAGSVRPVTVSPWRLKNRTRPSGS